VLIGYHLLQHKRVYFLRILTN